jgi:DNA/RNA endonuclease YhcR with UshA esterase domain
MKRTALAVALFLGFCTYVWAADRLSASEASAHIGEQATVCGTVASAHYARSSRGAPTFLNLDKPYPDHIFTALIWGDARERFSNPPEMLKGRSICVSGMIKAYHGIAEIIVESPAQIEVTGP